MASAVAVRRQPRPWRIYLLARATMALALALLLSWTGLPVLAALPVGIAMVAFFSLVDECEARRRVRKAVRRGRHVGWHTLRLTPDQLRLEGPSGATEWPLERITDVNRHRGFLVVDVSAGESCVVPEHAVRDGDVAAFAIAVGEAAHAARQGSPG